MKTARTLASIALAAALAACGSTPTGNGPVYPATGSNGNPPGITAVAFVEGTGWGLAISNQSSQPFDFGSWVLVFYDSSGHELGSLYYSTAVVYSYDPAGSSPASPLTAAECAALVMPGQKVGCVGLFPTGSTAPAGTTRAVVADIAPVIP